MGSVTSRILCPFCKGPAISDYYYKTREEFNYCTYCGWSEKTVITNSEDRQNQDWKAKYNTSGVSSPVGAIILQEKGDFATQMGTICTSEQEERCRCQIREKINDLEIAFISKFIDKQIVRENLITGEVKVLDPRELQEELALSDDDLSSIF